MSEAEVVKFNLKALINKEKTRVLFAEVDNDFADLLLSFSILPLGYIIDVMEKHYGDKTPCVIGSLSTLYHSLSDQAKSLFQLHAFKPSILNPECAYAFPFLNQKLDFNGSDNRSLLLSLDKAYFVVHRMFTEKNASFIIGDDLRIVPNGNGSIVQTLNGVGVDISDVDGAETRNVTFGLNETMDFLKGFWISHQPLTDMILGGATIKSKTGIPLHQIEKGATFNSIKIYDLKVMLQKSTKKLLFAQADKDFVSFLFTMLAFPLGLVDWHLGGNTCLNKVNNLYRGIAKLVDPKLLNVTDTKDRLMKLETYSYTLLIHYVTNAFNDEGSRMYLLKDDLTVRPLCVFSTLSSLSQMKISTSDVKEVELYIGSKEARNIMKASLTSTTALSDGLNYLLLKARRKLKQEH